MLRATVVRVIGLTLALAGIAWAQEAPPRRELVSAGVLCTAARGSLVWSPTGQHLAFLELLLTGQSGSEVVAERIVRVIGIDGSASPPLAADDAPLEPTWSPDGQSLAYISEDPATPGRGDLVAVRLADGAQTRITRGGGHYAPRWLATADGERFLVLRDGGERVSQTTTLLLISPRETDPARATVPLAIWTRTGSGISSVEASPSGDRAFVIGALTSEGARRLAIGVLRLRVDGAWPTSPVEPEWLPVPEALAQASQPRWSTDGTAVAFLGKGQRELTWQPWVATIDPPSFRRVSSGGGTGFYVAAEWADDGRALLGLHVPGTEAPGPPSLRILPLDGSRPSVVEPGWEPLAIDSGVELAGDPSGTRFAIAARGEIRVLQLGSTADAAKRASAANLERLGRALVDWAQLHPWAPPNAAGAIPWLLPDPQSEPCRTATAQHTRGVEWQNDGFWIPLVRSVLNDLMQADFDALLWCPGAPRGSGRRSSYLVQEEAYGLDVSPLARAPEGTVLLRERDDSHPDGHFVLEWLPSRVDRFEVRWIPNAPAP